MNTGTTCNPIVSWNDPIRTIEQYAIAGVDGQAAYRRYLRDFFVWLRHNNRAVGEQETWEMYAKHLANKYRGGSFAPIWAALRKGIGAAAMALLPPTAAEAVQAMSRRIKVPRSGGHGGHVDRTITRTEELSVLRKMTERDGALFEFLMATGCRIGEALGIEKTRDLTRGAGMAAVRIHGKGNKYREIYLPMELLFRIETAYPGKRYLFETKRGKKVDASYVYRRIRGKVEQTTERRFSPHGCRHTFAKRWIAETGRVDAVSRYLGHASAAVTLDFYSKDRLSASDIDAAYRRGKNHRDHL